MKISIKKCKIDFNLKMLVISDTHSTLVCNDVFKELVKDDYDVCLLLGDLSCSDIEIIKKSITNKPIYGVVGNHDSWDLLSKYEIEDIHCKQVEVKGVKISGFGGALKYKPGNDYPCYSDKESYDLTKKIAKSDIFISHDSPKKLYEKRGAKSGLIGITSYIVKNKVPLNIHGHHHINDMRII